MMKIKFLILLSLAVWQGANALQGGTNAAIGQFPSFVSIFLPTTTAICGGAILNQNHVLTTTQCMLNPQFLLLPANQVQVLPGSNNINMTAPRTQVFAIYTHPQYNPFNFDNDVAVIRTLTPINFPNTLPVLVAPGILNEQIAFDTQVCVLAAWNRNNNLLQTISPPIVNREQCTELAANQGRITETMICAGVLTAGPGVCIPNVGAILYCDGRITGILNSGYGCGAANNPGVYMQTRFYQRWITEQMQRQDVPAANSNPLERFP